MLKAFPEESVHSYIVRILGCVGELKPQALKGIISESGLIYVSPSVLLEHSRYLARVGGCANSAAVAHCANEALLGKNQSNRKGSFVVDACRFYGLSGDTWMVGVTQMRFCPYCFREQIRDDGVVWFKKDWLFDEWCFEHDLLMLDVKRYMCDCGDGVSRRIFASLQSVLRGRCRECDADIWDRVHAESVKSNASSLSPKKYHFHKILN